MAKFTLIEPYNSYSGKTCSHSQIINVLGRKGVRRDKQWTSRICHPRDLSVTPLTTDEKAARNRFKAVHTAVLGVKDNDTKLNQAMVAFAAVKNQYKSFDAYLWKVQGDLYDESQD